MGAAARHSARLQVDQSSSFAAQFHFLYSTGGGQAAVILGSAQKGFFASTAFLISAALTIAVSGH